ncbi:uncharacterized protein LOC143589487 [Bidens hawaiensis]|uniref:uncharacterized protein LOC143589487 n=1 Tax=Bidens hawaiensis TaxID=980011 RepID=UPI00404B5550
MKLDSLMKDLKDKALFGKLQADLLLSETQLKNLALLEIQNFLLRNNCSLRCFPTMPFPDDDSISASTNRFMNEELTYDTHLMTGEFERLYNSLTDEQRNVYNEIMEAVDANIGGVFFVYGYGGTGYGILYLLPYDRNQKSF